MSLLIGSRPTSRTGRPKQLDLNREFRDGMTLQNCEFAKNESAETGWTGLGALLFSVD
jgi:hypothetical protein